MPFATLVFTYLLADEGTTVSGGQVAAIMAITNLLTGAAVAFGAWWIGYRKQKQEFAKENREQGRIDRRETAAEWERLVDLYGKRIMALEMADREKDSRLFQVEEAERGCQRRLRQYWRILKENNLRTDSDETDSPSPVPKPPEDES